MQAGGALIGPHALAVIKDLEAVRHVAELGVVFLLFNIGLELSLERLRSMQKYVFGLGTSQVCFPNPGTFLLERCDYVPGSETSYKRFTFHLLLVFSRQRKSF